MFTLVSLLLQPANKPAPVNTEDPKWKQRLDPSKRYEPCKLCIFCMQFFDKNFVEYISYHKGTTKLKDKALDMEGERADSGLDENVSRVLEKKKPGTLIPLNMEHIEPVLQDLAFLHLKTMSEKPRLMETMGCQLARYSNPANRIKLKTTTYGGGRRRSEGPKKLRHKGANETYVEAEHFAYAPTSGAASSGGRHGLRGSIGVLTPKKRNKNMKVLGTTAALGDARPSRLVTHERKERANRFTDQIMTQSTDFGGGGDGGVLCFPPISLTTPPAHSLERSLDGALNSGGVFLGGRGSEYHSHHHKQGAPFSEEIKLAVSDGIWKKSNGLRGRTVPTLTPHTVVQERRMMAL